MTAFASPRLSLGSYMSSIFNLNYIYAKKNKLFFSLQLFLSLFMTCLVLDVNNT